MSSDLARRSPRMTKNDKPRNTKKPSGWSPLDAALETLRQADVLLAGPASGSLATWLADNFNKNFDAYDRAIDAVYNATHIGGSRYHHLLDGQHTIWGALEAVKNVSPNDSFARQLTEASEHLLRDSMSVSGINPFLSPSAFESIAGFGESLGISRAYLADALTINGPELLGGAVALAASLAIGRHGDPSRLSYLSGAYVVSALSSGNPLLLPIAAGGLAYSLRQSADKRTVLVEGGKGALVSGSSLLMASLVGGPVWLGCATAVLTGVAVKYAIDDPSRALERTKRVTDAAATLFKEGARTLKEIYHEG